jgi:hypothetical protein
VQAGILEHVVSPGTIDYLPIRSPSEDGGHQWRRTGLGVAEDNRRPQAVDARAPKRSRKLVLVGTAIGHDAVDRVEERPAQLFRIRLSGIRRGFSTRAFAGCLLGSAGDDEAGYDGPAEPADPRAIPSRIHD